MRLARATISLSVVSVRTQATQVTEALLSHSCVALVIWKIQRAFHSIEHDHHQNPTCDVAYIIRIYTVNLAGFQVHF